MGGVSPQGQNESRTARAAAAGGRICANEAQDGREGSKIENASVCGTYVMARCSASATFCKPLAVIKGDAVLVGAAAFAAVSAFREVSIFKIYFLKIIFNWVSSEYCQCIVIKY